MENPIKFRAIETVHILRGSIVDGPVPLSQYVVVLRTRWISRTKYRQTVVAIYSGATWPARGQRIGRITLSDTLADITNRLNLVVVPHWKPKRIVWNITYNIGQARLLNLKVSEHAESPNGLEIQPAFALASHIYPSVSVHTYCINP